MLTKTRSKCAQKKIKVWGVEIRFGGFRRGTFADLGSDEGKNHINLFCITLSLVPTYIMIHLRRIFTASNADWLVILAKVRWQ